MEIGWIDFSKDERNKVVSILRLLNGQNALDELGIGSVRDAFSDMLFPGISVLQTRAKYFVIIPYLFSMAAEEQETKGKFKTGRDVLKYINDREVELVKVLMANSPGENGIVGSTASNHDVKLKPSAMYWNGLRITGILLHQGFSLDMACQAVLSGSNSENEGHLIFAPNPLKYNLFKDADICLTSDEAVFLYGHFTESAAMKGSLLAYMLRNPKFFVESESFEQINANKLKGVNDKLYRKLNLAQQFSDFIYGAHLLYNIIFADGCGVEDEGVVKIRKTFNEYMDNYISPELDAIIDVTGCKGSTMLFLKTWDKAMISKDVKKAKKIVVEREKQVKPRRNKLLRPGDYQYTAAIHNFKLNYRYGTARTIIKDILLGRGDIK